MMQRRYDTNVGMYTRNFIPARVGDYTAGMAKSPRTKRPAKKKKPAKKAHPAASQMGKLSAAKLSPEQRRLKASNAIRIRWAKTKGDLPGEDASQPPPS